MEADVEVGGWGHREGMTRWETEAAPNLLWAETAGGTDLPPDARLPSALPRAHLSETPPKSGRLVSTELGWQSWRPLPPPAERLPDAP